MTLNNIIAIGLRNLRQGKKLLSLNSIASVIGSLLSVAVLIVVMSVMNGFRDELTAKMLNMSAHINIRNSDAHYINEPNEIIEYIESMNIKEIASINAPVYTEAMITNESSNNSSGVRLKGFSQDLPSFLNTFERYRLKQPEQVELKSDEILLTSAVASRLRIQKDDKVKLTAMALTQPKAEVDIGLKKLVSVPVSKTYKVVGFVKSGMQSYDEFHSFGKAEHFNTFTKRPKGSASYIEVYLKNNNNLDETANNLSLIIEQRFGKKVAISTWQDDNKAFLDALKTERIVMFLILSLFVIISTFVIFANMTLMVNNKAKNIAILRTMGMSSREVGVAFFISGISLSLTGITMGVITGIGIANNIQNIRDILEKTFKADLFNPAVYFLSYLPSNVQAKDVVNVFAMSLILSIIASIVPAIKAANKEPAKVFKH